jgi:hypothetical protein
MLLADLFDDGRILASRAVKQDDRRAGLQAQHLGGVVGGFGRECHVPGVRGQGGVIKAWNSHMLKLYRLRWRWQRNGRYTSYWI